MENIFDKYVSGDFEKLNNFTFVMPEVITALKKCNENDKQISQESTDEFLLRTQEDLIALDNALHTSCGPKGNWVRKTLQGLSDKWWKRVNFIIFEFSIDDD